MSRLDNNNNNNNTYNELEKKLLFSKSKGHVEVTVFIKE